MSAYEPRPRPRTFQLTEEVSPEVEIQADIFRKLMFLLLPPAFIFAMPVGHIQLTKQQAARLNRIGLRRGLPDLWILYRGRVYCLEVKRPGGKLSETKIVRTARGGMRVLDGQAETFDRLVSAGAHIEVVTDADEAIDVCHAWHLPMRV